MATPRVVRTANVAPLPMVRAKKTEAIGALGLPIYSGYLRLDPVARLNGVEAIRTYRDMRYNEPAVAAFVTAVMNLFSTDLSIEPGGPKRADTKAQRVAQTALECMEQPAAAALRQMYSAVWYGWDVHEVVMKRAPDGRIGWRGWELRRQESLQRWLTAPDDAGRVVGFEQRPAPDYRLRAIPFERAIHIVSDDSEGSPEGLSALRGMYRPWYFVKQFELFMGIAGERFGTGVPIFEVGESVATRLTPTDQETMQAAVEGLRQNEEAGIITPPGVTFRFAESPGLRISDYLEILRYLRIVMLSVAQADFIALGTQQSGGAYSLGKDKSELFLMAVNGYQQRILDALNQQLMPRLFNIAANRVPGMTALPRFALPAIRRYDLTQLGQFMQLMDSIGALTLTDEDESYLRKITDLLDMTPAQIKQAKEEAKKEAKANMPPQFQGPEDSATGDAADDDEPDAMQMGPAEEMSDAEGADDDS
jgi:hypothetical protein